MSFSSLCIFWKKLFLMLCFKELILYVDFKSEDRLFHKKIGYSIRRKDIP